MRKFKYFILLFILTVIFIPKDTFAKSYSIVPSEAIFVRSDKTFSTITSFQESTVNERFFHYFNGSGDTYVNDVRWNYNSTFGLNKKNTYDANFSVLVPNIGVANDKGFQSGKPLVTYNASVCDVYPLASTFSSSITYSQIFNVVCRNVEIEDVNSISVFTPSTSQSSSSLVIGGDASYGISSTFNFVVHNSSSEISGAILENTEEIKKQTEETKKQTETIKDTNTSEANDKASNFFNNFEDNNHGLSGIVTAPLTLLQSLTASTCTPLTFELPIVHNSVTLPCMKSIYEDHFGIFFSLWQMLTTGLISYNVCLNFYKKVRDLQNPNNDRIEVLNL